MSITMFVYFIFVITVFRSENLRMIEGSYGNLSLIFYKNYV